MIAEAKGTNSPSQILGIIPARYASSRFPGKPLALISGKSLIQHTYENSKRCCKLDQLIVATDDSRIFDHVNGFGGAVMMTSTNCPTGSDRLVDALKRNPLLNQASIIVNIQGDVPCIDPEMLEQVIDKLVNDPKAVMSTAVIKIKTEKEAFDPSVVKCVFDHNDYALYFSRGLIPYGHQGKFQPDQNYYQHIGIYAYRRDFLWQYAQLPMTPLQIAEDLEQLKVLEHGFSIKVAIVDKAMVDINTPEDIKKVEQLLCT